MAPAALRIFFRPATTAYTLHRVPPITTGCNLLPCFSHVLRHLSCSSHHVRLLFCDSHQARPLSCSSHHVRPLSCGSHHVRPLSSGSHHVRPLPCGSHHVRHLSCYSHRVRPLSCVSHPVRHFHVSCDRPSALSDIYTSVPVLAAQKMLVCAHDFSGLPWWATVLATTFLVRSSVTFPLSVYQNYFMAKFYNLKPVMDATVEQLKAEVRLAQRRFNWSEKKAKRTFNRAVSKIRTQLWQNHNCHPLKNLVIPFIQLPIWFSITLALRNLVTGVPLETVSPGMVQLQLSAGGTLWFNNLLLPDTTFLLAILMCCFNLISVEIGQLRSFDEMFEKRQRSLLAKVQVYTVRGVCIVFVPFTYFAPSVLVLYWTCSAFHALLSNILLKMPRVRRALAIPRTVHESEHPFAALTTAPNTSPSSNTAHSSKQSDGGR